MSRLGLALAVVVDGGEEGAGADGELGACGLLGGEGEGGHEARHLVHRALQLAVVACLGFVAADGHRDGVAGVEGGAVGEPVVDGHAGVDQGG